MEIALLANRFYDYSRYIRGYTPKTIARYRAVINYYRRCTNVTAIEEVNETNIRSFFFVGRAEKRWQVGTYIMYHNSLTVFFRWCVAQKYLAQSPMEAIEMPKPEKRIAPKLTKQHTLRLLDVVLNYPQLDAFLRYRNHAIFSTFVFAGLRKSELLNLKVSDVDLEGMTLFVRQGKGAKDRIIPLNHTLVATLTKYSEERRKLKKTCPEFFTSYRNNAGFGESGLDNLSKKITAASGIAFTIHKLRHTFATLMLEGGCDIYSLSKMMGHSDIKTTTIYLAASPEHLRVQVMKHPLNTV